MGWGVRGGLQGPRLHIWVGLGEEQLGGHRGAKLRMEPHSNLGPEPRMLTSPPGRAPWAEDKTVLTGGKVHLPKMDKCCPPPLGHPPPQAPCTEPVGNSMGLGDTLDQRQRACVFPPGPGGPCAQSSPLGDSQESMQNVGVGTSSSRGLGVEHSEGFPGVVCSQKGAIFPPHKHHQGRLWIRSLKLWSASQPCAESWSTAQLGVGQGKDKEGI